ncbi:MAG TPA: hypothetical protein ENN28_00115 [Candidatus Uhrbacteria bacterium]|nr:hypothetical protein [Candidatus Uhrbacteria bacterium]
MKIFKPKESVTSKILPKKKKNMPKALKIVLVLIIIIGVCALILWQTGYLQAFKMALQIQKQQQVAAEDAKVLKQLGKIMALPEDVQPTMAIITDIDALREGQPDFFAEAKNEDRLILYPTMAIVYDYKANKIIKVGPVQFTGDPDFQAVPFAIYNSLRDSDRTEEIENKLKSAFNNVNVIVKETAAKYDYPQTLVIDLIGNEQELARIAEAVGGVASSLPEGETAPEGAAVLVIIGRE